MLMYCNVCDVCVCGVVLWLGLVFGLVLIAAWLLVLGLIWLLLSCWVAELVAFGEVCGGFGVSGIPGSGVCLCRFGFVFGFVLGVGSGFLRLCAFDFVVVV